MFLLKDVLKRDVLKRKVYRTVDHGPLPPHTLKFALEAFVQDRNFDLVAFRPRKAQHLSYDTCAQKSKNH